MHQDVIQYVTIASTGDASDFGNLLVPGAGIWINRHQMDMEG